MCLRYVDLLIFGSFVYFSLVCLRFIKFTSFRNPTVFQRVYLRFLSILSLLEIDRVASCRVIHSICSYSFSSKAMATATAATDKRWIFKSIWFAYANEINKLLCVECFFSLYLMPMLALARQQMLQIEVDGLNELICSALRLQAREVKKQNQKWERKKKKQHTTKSMKE